MTMQFDTENHSFITGSYAYGTPEFDSDLDVVIRMDNDVDGFFKLVEMGQCAETCYGGEGVNGQVSLRFGKLNLIVCLNDTYFLAWKTATAMIQDIRSTTGKRVDKDLYVEVFRRVFNDLGLE
jgi:hypothetical protein